MWVVRSQPAGLLDFPHLDPLETARSHAGLNGKIQKTGT
jgi:hypothetical protein